MDHLADSTAYLCQGGKNRYIGREGVPMDDSPVKGCGPVLTRLLKHFSRRQSRELLL